VEEGFQCALEVQDLRLQLQQERKQQQDKLREIRVGVLEG
jgi:hypothetical protein